MATPKIREKIRNSILHALSAGVVPSQGIQYIQVGRAPEIKAMIRGINSVADGSSIFKMVVGNYGSGKTFFMQLVRKLGFEKKLVTMHADFSPERRLVASGGQARNLYSQLINNMSTRSRPEGGALPAIIDMFVGDSIAEALEKGVTAERLINEKLMPLRELVAGYDFSRVISHYCRGHELGDDALKQSALRWLKGEFSAKTDARKELGGVRSIIDDKTIYDAIKLMSKFLRIAGHDGLLVILDEAVNLFKITHAHSRTSNYELVLTMLNETLQSSSSTEGLGILFGITPEALFDQRRGLCSYDALASRLSKNPFAEQHGLIDYNHPTIELQSLTPEELYLLLVNIRIVFASGDESSHLINDDGIKAFMSHCQKTIGSAYFKTPRETVRGFVNLLSMLDQYPDTSWTDFIDQLQINTDQCNDDSNDSTNDQLKNFTM